MYSLESFKYDENIVLDLKQKIGEFSFKLEQIEDIEFKIYIYKYMMDDGYWFSTNYFIHTPLQATPYLTSRTRENTYERALKRAIDSITSYYSEAIIKGLKPDKNWFIKNENF